MLKTYPSFIIKFHISRGSEEKIVTNLAWLPELPCSSNVLCTFILQ